SRPESVTESFFISLNSDKEDDMKQAYFSKAASALPVMVILALAAAPWSGQSASPKVTISIVSDDAPGLAARHGLNKLAGALKARGVAVEQANSLEAVRGETLIVAGGGGACGGGGGGGR